jgi:hypothetical protein
LGSGICSQQQRMQRPQQQQMLLKLGCCCCQVDREQQYLVRQANRWRLRCRNSSSSSNAGGRGSAVHSGSLGS